MDRTHPPGLWRRARRPIAAVAILGALGLGWTRVGAQTGGYNLTNSGFGSGSGDTTSDDFGLSAAAGQAGLGDATGGNVGLSGGAIARPDACPMVAGTNSRQGCDLALEPNVTLHVVDQAKSGECRALTGVDAPSCSAPLAQARVKVFDRAKLDGLTITKRDRTTTIKLTKNPSGDLYADVYESPEANASARAAALGCVTIQTGRCLAGLTTRSGQLVILRWDAPSTATRVYTGLPYGGDNFGDSDGDGTADLATKSLQVVKTIKKDGSVVYTGGSKTVVTGSYLEIVRPDRAYWESTAGGYLYPFAMTADSDWQVELCATLPTGYLVTGAYDENANALSPVTNLLGTCVTSAVTKAAPKVIAFQVVQVGSPVGDPALSVTARTFHKGERKEAIMSVPGARGLVAAP